MSWLNHPKVRGIRDSILTRFVAREYKFRSIPPVVFLCGGAGSARRDRIAQYLRTRTDTLVFYADDVWSRIADRPDLNALQMESILAELSDVVLIVVESPGTFTELGAFSLSDPLRRKLLPIVDVRFRDSSSFISTGPLRWIDRDSVFQPTLYADFGTILSISPDLDDRLTRVARLRRTKITDLAASPKHLVFVLCDLIAVFGPCSSTDANFLITRLLSSAPVIDVPSLLGLAVAMRLITRVRDASGIDHYFRRLTGDRLAAFQRSKYLDLAAERARILSTLLAVDEGRALLSLLSQT